jgi:hypothetical protein
MVYGPDGFPVGIGNPSPFPPVRLVVFMGPYSAARFPTLARPLKGMP